MGNATSCAVRVENLKKSYSRNPALRGVDLDLPAGMITVLLGPSGCGKTTLLRILAGLAEPDAGRVEIGGEVVNAPRSRVPPERRGLGMVFQDALLWPHLTVRANIGFPVRGRHGAADAVVEAAEAARIVDLLDRYPAQVSGGERQRAAIARAIVRKPRLLLLDEPLSGLDAHLRLAMLDTIQRIQRTLGVTACYVTHDQEEALGIADRIAVMRNGQILQVGSAEDVYRRPRTAFVAGFVGLSTLIPGEADGSGAADTELGRIAVKDGAAGSVLLAARPESVVLGRDGGIPAVVERARFLGGRWLLSVRAGTREVLAVSDRALSVGEQVTLAFDPPPVTVSAEDWSSPANGDRGQRREEA